VNKGKGAGVKGREIAAVLAAVQSLNTRVEELVVEQRRMKDYMMDRLKAFEEREMKECQSVRGELLKEIGTLKDQLRGMETRLYDLEGDTKSELITLDSRVEKVEETTNPEFHPDVTVVVTGLRHEQNENIHSRCEKLLKDGVGADVDVARVVRAPTNDGRVVKIRFKSKADKITTLKNKRNLLLSRVYERVFIQSAFPHAEWTTLQNTQTLMQELNMGDKYRIAGNGRIALKENQGEGATSSGKNWGWQDVRGRGRGYSSSGQPG